MNPSKNNQGQNSNNQSNNSFQNNPNFLNFTQPYGESKIIQEEQIENLLEDDIDQVNGHVVDSRPSYASFSNNIFNNQQQNNGSSQYSAPQTNFIAQNPPASINPSNQLNFLTNQAQQIQVPFENNLGFSNQQIPQHFVPPSTRNPNLNALSRASKLDECLMLLLRQNQHKPENDVGSKGPSKIQEKSKKAVSRLSQQFFAKSGNPDQNMKSKKKSRQTVSTFGMDYKNDFLDSNNQGGNLDSEKDFFAKPIPISNQPQKMEIQSIHSEVENSLMIPNSPSYKEKRVQEPLVHPQNRMSQVKKKRQRLSYGMEGLANLIKTFGSDKKEKKIQPVTKSQPASRQNNRVTMDLSSVINFLESKQDESGKSSVQSGKNSAPFFGLNEKQKQSKDSKQNKSTPQISENLRHLAEYVRPKINIPEPVIPEDQREDEVTPLKSPLKEKSITHELSRRRLSSIFPQSKRKSFHQKAQNNQKSKPIADLPKDYYTRQIFNIFFSNLNDRVHFQKKKCEQLANKKAQALKKINNKLSQFTINAQKLAEWKEQDHQIRERIYAIKQKVNKAQFDKNSQLIHEFQLKFGIQLHRLQKTQNEDGIYIEFTYEDILFRVQRHHKTNDTKCKFLQRLVSKKAKKDFEFTFEEKTEFIQTFTSKKIKQTKNLIPFMILLIRYLKALQKFELTVTHYAYTNCIKDLQIGQKKTEMEFCFTSGSKYDFLFAVDVLELLNNGGITVYSVTDKKSLEISQEFLTYQENGNKLGKCFIFVERYVAQLVSKEIENSARTK